MDRWTDGGVGGWRGERMEEWEDRGMNQVGIMKRLALEKDRNLKEDSKGCTEIKECSRNWWSQASIYRRKIRKS